MRYSQQKSTNNPFESSKTFVNIARNRRYYGLKKKQIYTRHSCQKLMSHFCNLEEKFQQVLSPKFCIKKLTLDDNQEIRSFHLC